MIDYFQSLIANCASKWRPAAGHEGLYDISDDGEVRSLDRSIVTRGRKIVKRISGRRLSPVLHCQGYHIVTLCRNGETRPVFIHRLVIEAHRGRIAAGMDVDHINGIRTDNRLGNLRVVTRRQNIRNKVHDAGSCGHRGIYYRDDQVKKWVAKIHMNRRGVNLGSFATRDEAIAARLSAEKRMWGDDAPSAVRQ